MNIIPGSSFFQTVPGSTGQAGAAKPQVATNATIQAQASDAQPRAESSGKTPAGQGPAPFGPRGSIIDIIA